jgi:hypothetical protein
LDAELVLGCFAGAGMMMMMMMMMMRCVCVCHSEFYEELGLGAAMKEMRKDQK